MSLRGSLSAGARSDAAHLGEAAHLSDAAHLSSATHLSEEDQPSAGGEPVGQQRLDREQQLRVRELANRDREVRAHELAHSSVGGRYAGAPQYTYEHGPDGRSYAVAGEVPIDVAPVAGNPRATIEKAQRVQRAALAPVQPSAQDLAVAAQAAVLEQQARQELAASAAQPSDSPVQSIESGLAADRESGASLAVSALKQFEAVGQRAEYDVVHAIDEFA